MAKWIGEVIYVYTKADRTLGAFCIVHGLLKLRMRRAQIAILKDMHVAIFLLLI